MIKARFLLFIFFFSSCNQGPAVFNEPNSFDVADGTKFIVLGDWGRRGNAKQQAVANAMAFVAQTHPIDFVISTGDNFYQKGVKSIHDKHWQESFENVYSDKSLHVPWYTSLGNHDYWGNIEAQMEYTNHSDRWKMQAAYYTQSIVTQDSAEILLVITDTQTLKKESNGFQAHYAWLDSALKYSTADWKIVVGHHPIRTGGKHGENTNLVQYLKRILDRHNTDVYFAGHDHDLQLLKDDNIHYVVSGSGSSTRKVKETPYTLFQKSALGFVLGSINETVLYLYFINEQGILLYSTTIIK